MKLLNFIRYMHGDCPLCWERQRQEAGSFCTVTHSVALGIGSGGLLGLFFRLFCPYFKKSLGTFSAPYYTFSSVEWLVYETTISLRLPEGTIQPSYHTIPQPNISPHRAHSNLPTLEYINIIRLVSLLTDLRGSNPLSIRVTTNLVDPPPCTLRC